MSHSQLLLDIEHDLSLIKDRLGKLEDQFEDDGLIAQIAESLHRIAVEVEQLKARQAGDEQR